jgi:hypothetical protein
MDDVVARARPVYLRSSGIEIHDTDLRADHLLQAVLVEDACWALAVDDWASRRPRTWRRRRMRSWYVEHGALATDRRRIQHLAGYCGALAPEA